MYSTSTSWWLITSLLVIPIFLQAQLLQNQRLELPINKGDDVFEVLPAAHHGLVLYRMQDKQSTSLQLVHLDTAFKEKWSGFIQVENRLKLALKGTSGYKTYFLFHQRDFSNIHFTVCAVDLQEQQVQSFTINNYIPFLPMQMEATDHGILLGGYFLGRVPVIIFYDFAIGKSRILPGLFNEPGELIQIKKYPDGSFAILISARHANRQNTLWIKQYDANGNLLLNTTITPDEDNSLLFGKILTVNQDEQVIAGVYGNRNSQYSKGLFLARLDPQFEQQIFYYPFTQLENFFKYMKDKREKRVRERITRKTIKGKKIRLYYRFLVHEFDRFEDEFILLGEAFYPKYKNFDSQLGYGLVPGYYQPVFDGYQYTHAVILGFNSAGQLLWDNSFEINDVKSYTLDQFVRMNVQDERINLLYLFNDKIRTKSISRNQVLEGKKYNPLISQLEHDELLEDTRINKLEYWYGDRFLAYGLEPTSRYGKRVKFTFFVSKLRYGS